MLKIEKTEVVGFEAAIRGMRNPKNSWEKSDSEFITSDGDHHDICGHSGPWFGSDGWEEVLIGENDLNLMTTLRNAGTDHRKFMRMIVVYLDITAPLYWWKEFDTYKVGTVANSCSTMHKIHAKEFTLDDFSYEHLIDSPLVEEEPGKPALLNMQAREMLVILVNVLNAARYNYLKTNDKKYWWQMIQLLPTSYNQKRTVMLNYEVLANIYKSRKDHKLDEWHTFCDWIEGLPYSKLITAS
jgi:hypothetical protein|nr:MAG TPA: hypothetical protein [Caudoviricetes sp.]